MFFTMLVNAAYVVENKMVKKIALHHAQLY